MIGPAFTVKCVIGDARAVAHAVDQATPGDVLVIDAGGTDLTTPWGSMSATAAKLRGLAGCVTNGGVRDFDKLVELDFPFSRQELVFVEMSNSIPGGSVYRFPSAV